MSKCLVYQISNLRTLFDEDKQKWFQVFNCGTANVVTGAHYTDGQIGVFIPAGAVVPDDILKDMWLYGRLAGKKRNRVVSKPMFGYPSEGIFYGDRYTNNEGVLILSPAWRSHWKIGDDVTEELGIKFYDSRLS